MREKSEVRGDTSQSEHIPEGGRGKGGETEAPMHQSAGSRARARSIAHHLEEDIFFCSSARRPSISLSSASMYLAMGRPRLTKSSRSAAKSTSSASPCSAPVRQSPQRAGEGGDLHHAVVLLEGALVRHVGRLLGPLASLEPSEDLHPELQLSANPKLAHERRVVHVAPVPGCCVDWHLAQEPLLVIVAVLQLRGLRLA